MPDPGKVQVIRKLLRLKQWQEDSDRAVARAAGCSRHLVGAVRRQAIAEGSHPPQVPQRGKGYKPGPVKVRGGYLMLPTGETVREAEQVEAELAALRTRFEKARGAARGRSPGRAAKTRAR